MSKKAKYNKEQQNKWFPYSISEKSNDFIFQNGVHGHCNLELCGEDC
jgi:hypothetical protein